MALGLVPETEIDRVGGREGLWCGFHDGVQANAGRSQVFGDEGIADGIVIDTSLSVEYVQRGGIARGRIQREAVVDQGIAVGPAGRVGIDVRLAKVVEKGKEQACFASNARLSWCVAAIKSGQDFLCVGDMAEAERKGQSQYLKIRLHILCR